MSPSLTGVKEIIILILVKTVGRLYSRLLPQGYYNRGERSTLDAAETSGDLQPRSKGRESVDGKLLRGDIGVGGFLLNWPN